MKKLKLFSNSVLYANSIKNKNLTGGWSNRFNIMDDRMYRICEEGFKFKDGDFEYFVNNVKKTDFGECFRIAVEWDNYDVSDYLIAVGYHVKNDMNFISDLLYYVDREMIEKIEYMVNCGFQLNEKLMVMIVEEYYEYKYYHADNGFLLKIMGLYGRCCECEIEE